MFALLISNLALAVIVLGTLLAVAALVLVTVAAKRLALRLLAKDQRIDEIQYHLVELSQCLSEWHYDHLRKISGRGAVIDIDNTIKEIREAVIKLSTPQGAKEAFRPPFEYALGVFLEDPLTQPKILKTVADWQAAHPKPATPAAA